MISDKIEALRVLPNSVQKKWLMREKAIFFHFGINTFTGKEWGDGTEGTLRRVYRLMSGNLIQ